MKKKPKPTSLLTHVLWAAVAVVGQFLVFGSLFGACALWKGNPDEVLADCKAVEAELEQFKATHGRYPETLQEAGINAKRRHSEVCSYENKGDYFLMRVGGNYYSYSYGCWKGWDPIWGGG